MKMNNFSKLATLAVASVMCSVASAVAFDSASDPGYAGGWVNNSNGGSGFSPWYVIQMADGGQASIGTGAFVSIPVGGPAWCIRTTAPAANNYNGIIAGRQVLGGYGIGETLSFDFDNGAFSLYGDSHGGSGFSIDFIDDNFNAFAPPPVRISAGLSNWFGYNFTSNYLVNGVDSGVAITNMGMHAALTVTGLTTYRLDLTPIGGSTTTINGTFAGGYSGRLGWTEFRAFNNLPSEKGDFYINNMGVVPEPATMAVLGAGALALLRRRRSK